MKEKKIIKILAFLLAAAIAVSVVLAILLLQNVQGKAVNKQWNSAAVSKDVAAKDGIYKDEYMQEAIKNACDNEHGGPFGAVITKKDGELVVSTCNHALDGNKLNHAEVYAITRAQEILGTRDLSDCVMYSSAEPCLMCATAISYANISKVYYAASFADSVPFGYDDEKTYNAILEGSTLTKWVHVDEENRLWPFETREKK